jgi:molybdenum cofactor biosynthesis enzyme MoaA
MLDEATRHELVRIGLDRLWVSIDGATPESYTDVRLWDALPQVTEDLARLRELRIAHGSGLPRLGIAFVAMKRNIADLPEVIRLGQQLGADRFSVSNVLPHTPEMRDQVLYARSIDAENAEPSSWAPEVSLARMDVDELTIERLARVAAGRNGRSLPGRAAGGARTGARSRRRGASRFAGTGPSAPACRSSTLEDCCGSPTPACGGCLWAQGFIQCP